MPDTVSTIDAAVEAGLTYRQVSYWIGIGVITPAFGTGGSGFPYRFSRRQVWSLRQIGQLYRLLEGVGPPQTDFIGRVWDALEETGSFRWSEGPLVISLPWPPDDRLPDSDPEPVA